MEELKVFVWRHNKTHHSHSMINEPCLNNNFYLDAIAVVAARNVEEAIAVLCNSKQGWRAEDLQEHPHEEISLDEAKLIFSNIAGNIDFL